MMPGVNYVIYDCYSARTTRGITIQEQNIVGVITQDRKIDDNLER